MFVSKVKIFVKAGNGGKGIISFRREKFVPFGGPNGGDGGKGGDIIFLGDKSINTLAYFKYHRHFFAKHGNNGSGSNCNGKSGEDVIIKIPIGTDIFNGEGKLILSMEREGQRVVVFPGGKGGIGNGGMATSTDRAPRVTLPPETREMQEIQMVLTLKTDVGILGAPNAGKSSLINCLSRANSIVGDYEFTTINPVLGQMYNTDISLMDLPGIIEGAYKGKGRGLEFLRHSEQCKIFIHLVDISCEPKKAYEMIIDELTMYGKQLIHKPSITVLNKIDLLTPQEVKRIKNSFVNAIGISTVTQEGIGELEKKIKEYFPVPQIHTESINEKIIISYEEEEDENLWEDYVNLLRLIGEKILESLQEKRGFSLTLTNSFAMKELNKFHRNKPVDTNVISLELKDNEFFLGEVILSYNKIYTEYKDHGNSYKSFEEYLAFVYIHGLMHLLGYDHENDKDAEIMEEKEKFYLHFISQLI
jgi:GTP-binding protein